MREDAVAITTYRAFAASVLMSHAGESLSIMDLGDHARVFSGSEVIDLVIDRLSGREYRSLEAWLRSFPSPGKIWTTSDGGSEYSTVLIVAQ